MLCLEIRSDSQRSRRNPPSKTHILYVIRSVDLCAPRWNSVKCLPSKKHRITKTRKVTDMALIIRPGALDDLPVIVEFNAAIAAETEHRVLDRVTLTKGVEAALRDPSKGRYFVADEKGTVVGQTMFTTEWSDWRNGVFWWIQSVYVREDKRGAGVFSALYRHIEGLAKQEGNVCGLRLYAEEENIRAQRTYEKLGMVKTGYRVFEVEF
jgi:GNAT superfamily N-acetyltransferase